MSLLKRIFGARKAEADGTPASVSAKQPAPVQAVEVRVDHPVADHAALARSGLRLHEWAMTPQGIGIVVGTSVGEGEVAAGTETLVHVALTYPPGTLRTRTDGAVQDISGLNRVGHDANDKPVDLRYTGAVSSVRRAFFDEIPVRGAEPPEEHEPRMRRYGYIHSSETLR